MKKSHIAAAAVSVVFVVALVIVIVDGSPPEDDHLKPAIYPTPSANNPLADGSAFLTETIVLPPEIQGMFRLKIRPIAERKEQNPDLARTVVGDNRHILELIEEALKVEHWMVDGIPNPSRLGDLSQLKRLQGVVAEADGSSHFGVFQDLEAVEIYSHILNRSEDLITFIVGTGGRGDVLRGNFTRRLKMIEERETLVTILEKLKATRFRPEIVQHVLKAEYQSYKKVLEDGAGLTQGYGWSGIVILRDKTSSDFADFFTKALDPLLPANSRNDLSVPDPRPYSLNYGGQKMLQDSSRVIDLTLESWIKRHAQHEALVVLTALRLYEIENGTLPEALKDLAPDYLEKPPLDIYDGQPLRYDLRNAWIYSVGPDFSDEGGDASDENFDSATEPTLRIRNEDGATDQ